MRKLLFCTLVVLLAVTASAFADEPRTPADKLNKILEHTYVNQPVAQAKIEQRTVLEDQAPPAWVGVSVATFKQPMHRSAVLDVRTVVHTSRGAGVEFALMW